MAKPARLHTENQPMTFTKYFNLAIKVHVTITRITSADAQFNEKVEYRKMPFR